MASDPIGVLRVLKNLSTYSANAVRNIVEAVEVTQAEVVNHARANHREGAHARGRFVSHHGSAGLVGSIQPGPILITNKEIEGNVEARARYAGYVEGDIRFKKSDIGVYPFLAPALKASQTRYVTRLRNAIKRATP